MQNTGFLCSVLLNYFCVHLQVYCTVRYSSPPTDCLHTLRSSKKNANKAPTLPTICPPAFQFTKPQMLYLEKSIPFSGFNWAMLRLILVHNLDIN